MIVSITRVEVTREMVDAAQALLPGRDLSEAELCALYRAMRRLEPGAHVDGPTREIQPARMGVKQQGVTR